MKFPKDKSKSKAGISTLPHTPPINWWLFSSSLRPSEKSVPPGTASQPGFGTPLYHFPGQAVRFQSS